VTITSRSDDGHRQPGMRGLNAEAGLRGLNAEAADGDRTGRAHDLGAALVDQVGRVVLGDPAPVRLAVAAFLAGGHVLIEDVPGVGKTLLAKTLARSVGGTFARVQGTPDLLPTDLTGLGMWEAHERRWVFQPGPLFRHVVLVDELNRATPRTQSALLEAMAEGQVSADGTAHALTDPFLVIATQNPEGDLGTFPLVAGQRDRFAVTISLGLPGRTAEQRLLAGHGGDRAVTALTPLAPPATWAAARAEVARLPVHDVVAAHVLDLVDAVRERVGGGPATATVSTRAALMLLAVARAHAVLAGRDHVAPDDVRAVAVAVLAHRVLGPTGHDLGPARALLAEIVHGTPAPPAASGVRCRA
jgi:MoxR-like ATPase